MCDGISCVWIFSRKWMKNNKTLIASKKNCASNWWNNLNFWESEWIKSWDILGKWCIKYSKVCEKNSWITIIWERKYKIEYEIIENDALEYTWDAKQFP